MPKLTDKTKAIISDINAGMFLEDVSKKYSVSRRYLVEVRRIYCKDAPRSRNKNFTDLTGIKIGLLTFVSPYGRPSRTQPQKWKVRCDCGTEKIVMASNVRYGTTKSCGCYQRARMKALNNGEEFNIPLAEFNPPKKEKKVILRKKIEAQVIVPNTITDSLPQGNNGTIIY